MNPGLEIAAILGVAILIRKNRDRLAGVARFVRWIFWLQIGIFSIVGVAGFRFVLLFLLRHESLVELLSQPNVFNASNRLMQGIALGFSLGAMVLYFAVMQTGNFGSRARALFCYLAVPVCALYPAVMTTAFGITDHPGFGLSIARWAMAISAVSAFCSVLFFRWKIFDAAFSQPAPN